MEIISVKDVTKKYFIHKGQEPTFKGAVLDLLRKRQPFVSFPAVDNVSFGIMEGETVGIIGENGSGKSTMLGLIAGTDRPTSGAIETRGSIATLLELGAGFHGDLTGRENIFLNGAILGFSHREMKEKYKGIVEFAELGEFIDTPVKHYSSGMYIRLGFAIAVEVSPDILIIDEVMAVGDEYFQKKCLRRIARFQEEKKTILFVSHALELVEKVCNRVILLESGRVRMDGPPKEVLKSYREFVREKDPVLSPKEWGTKEVVLKGVDFFDKDGKKTTKFMTGDTLRARISYEAENRVDNPVFGFSILGQDGKNYFGTNTQLEGFPIEGIEGEGALILEVERLSLYRGVFFLNFAVHSADHGVQYHRLDFIYEIEVENPSEEKGFLKLPCRWETGE
jgi:ABC-type polysaccharide/polyol phosphate transport system ATPase subunit